MPEVLAAWPDAVGPMVAANAWPARIARDGTLHVNTSSSTWAFELGQLAPTILARLHEALGEGVPKALRVRRRAPARSRPRTRRPRRRTEVPEPTEEALQRRHDLAAEIEDEELAQTGRKGGRAGPLSRPRPTSVSDTLTSARKVADLQGFFSYGRSSLHRKGHHGPRRARPGPETARDVHRLDGLQGPPSPRLRGGRQLGRRGARGPLRPRRGDHPPGRVDDRHATTARASRWT